MATYYVTDSGGTGTGSIGDPWSLPYAFSSAVAGDTVYIKAGLYSDYIITQNANGTAQNPIKFIGYKTTPGDIDPDAQTTKTEGTITINVLASFAYGDAVDSAEMPLMQENRSGLIGAGRALIINGDHVHLYNMQFQYYDSHMWASSIANNCVFKNLIGDECGGFATEGQSDGQGFRNDGGNNNTWKNIYTQNNGGIGFAIKGNDGIYDAITVANDDNRNPVDYYYLHQDTSAPVTGNTSTNIYVLRVGNLSHAGHGIVFKSPITGEVYNNTVTDFIIDNTVLEVQFPGVHNNTYTNGHIVQRSNSWSDNSGGITIANGSYSCIFNNIYIEDGGIRFVDWSDGLGGDVSNIPGSAGHDHSFNQITIDMKDRTLVYARPLVRFNYFASNNLDGSAENNTFYNCTFYDGSRLFERSRLNINTQFINCLFDTANGESSFTQGPGYPLDVSYSSVNFNAVGFSPIPTGTNVTTVDPQFVDAANGDFEVQNATLLGAGIATPYLSVGNNIGAVQNQGDILAPSVTQITVSNILDDIFKVSWNLDEASKGSIEYGTSTGVYTNNTPLRNQFSTSFVEEVGATIPLQSNTTYYWRIRTEDVTGNIGYSAEQNTTTISQLLRNNKPIGFGAGPIVKAYIGAINVIK